MTVTPSLTLLKGGGDWLSSHSTGEGWGGGALGPDI